MTDLGMLLSGHPALTSCANGLNADAAAGSAWGASDSLQLVVQARMGCPRGWEANDVDPHPFPPHYRSTLP